MKKAICVFLFIGVMFSLLSFTGYAENKKKEEKASLNVKAKAAVLMDASTGKILWEKNEHESLYPASVTKIMPLLLFMEALDSGKIKESDKVVCSPEAAAKGGSQIWLKDGEAMTVEELLKAVAIASANDACCALGEYIAGSEEAFVDMMNERAKELKMKDTHFDNCSGLDDDTDTHKSSAYDIAVMARELLKHEKIQKYSTVWMDSLRNGKTQLVNTNKLVRFYKGTTGLKTGTTQKAGKCLCASAKRNSLHLIAVVLGCQTGDERFESAKMLLNYGFAGYETAKLEFDKNLITEVRVIKGVKQSVLPSFNEAGSVTLKKGEKEKITTEISLVADVEAPLEKNQVLGSVEFKLGDEIIGKCKLYSDEKIEKLKVGDVIKMFFGTMGRYAA